MVPDTATPYADPRLSEVLNITTISKVPAISSQFAVGT